MTIYTRPDELVFAESAKNGEVAAFPDIPRGWGITFDQTEGEPPMEWFNDLFLRQDKAIRYLMQQGISEWSATDDYPLGGLIRHNGFCWQSLQDNRDSEPQDGSLYWKKFADVDGLRSELGTAAFANIGNSTGQIPDMSYFQSSSNHIITPDGTIMQWGTGVATNGYALVTFPVPMPTTAYTITVNERLTSGWGNNVIVYGYDYANSTTLRATITARQINSNGSITLPTSAAFAWQLMGHL